MMTSCAGRTRSRKSVPRHAGPATS